MKFQTLIIALVIVLLLVSCTVESYEDQIKSFQKEEVDPVKVKPPTGG
jgi:uncharacterized membrane protein YciS (DUF1049 family)